MDTPQTLVVKDTPASSPERPAGLSPSWIIVHLCLDVFCPKVFASWPNVFVHHYLFVILRICLLVAIALTLMYRGNPAAFCHYCLGRLLPRPQDWKIILLLLVAAVVGETAITVIGQHLKYGFSTHINFIPVPLTIQAVIDRCVLAPITEEIVFRGVFLGILLAQPQLTRWQAILLSAFIFLSEHTYHEPTITATVASGGILFGIAYARTRSVVVGMLLHFAVNASTSTPLNAWLSHLLFGDGY